MTRLKERTEADRYNVSAVERALDVLHACWSGEVFDYDGRFIHVRGGQQLPTPLTRIPVVIGGTGPRMMKLVAKHADWWNVPIHQLDRLDDMRANAGSARVSVQERIVFIADDADRVAIVEQATRRFGTMGTVVGNAEQLVAHYRERAELGVERFYTWFSDFAPPSTLEAFGARVISALA